jgi:hypothetical protein
MRDAGAPNLLRQALDDMPAFDDDPAPRPMLRAIAEYLVWLRTATADRRGALAALRRLATVSSLEPGALTSGSRRGNTRR